MLGRLFTILTLMISTPIAVPCQSPQEVRLSISGVVQDQAGSLIVGARVGLSKDSAELQSSLTDDTGGFRLNGVLFGDYQIRVTSPGFEPAIVAAKVGTLPSDSLRITMSVASIRQETTVTANPARMSTDPRDNQNAIAITGDSISDLPVFDQDYVSALSRFLDPASVGTNGVSLVVNGVEANSVTVSPSAIKEVKINQDPYSAEFARPGQERIEVITKPPEPTYHGTFNFIFRDAHLNARDAFALVRPPEQRRI